MFVKFNETGKLVAYSDVTDIKDIRPDSTGFEPLNMAVSIKDIAFLRKNGGVVSIDTAAKTDAVHAAAEAPNKEQRSRYIDAYRKYQAAVNYGEFAPVPAVDAFVAALKAKNWSALQNVPPQLKYFTGECGFSESGLISRI